MSKKTRVKVEKKMGLAEYLRRPYGRTVTPDSDGTFRAEIMEFPGCIATGDTEAEALANLKNVAESWLEATLAKGLRVPDPAENITFSGKFQLRLPKSLHRKAALTAQRENVSLNSFIVGCVAEQVGARQAVATQQRASSMGAANVRVWQVNFETYPDRGQTDTGSGQFVWSTGDLTGLAFKGSPHARG